MTPWRVGTKVPLNIYEGDRPVCQCHSALDAHLIVRAINQAKMPAETPNNSPTYTPGPWHRDPDMPTMILNAPLQQATEIIAQTSGIGNARLIAAAPELLAALRATAQSIVYQIQYHREMQESAPAHLTESLGIANAAIRKAEGRDA